MSDVEQVERRLFELAERVRKNKDAAEDSLLGAVDAHLAVGQALLEARQLLRSNQKYGDWFAAQHFGFSTQWGSVLRRCAAHKQEIRAASETQVSNGQVPNLRELLKEVESKSKVAAVGDGASSDASGAVSEATATPDTNSGEGSAPEPESVPGENEGGGASTREDEANSGPVQGSAEPPPPRVVDESTTDAEKDAIRDEWMAAIEATDDASDGDGPDGARSTGGPEPDEEPRAPTPVSSSGSNSAGSSARVAGSEPRRAPTASGSGTGRKRQQAKQDRGREIVISHRQVSVSERPVEYVEAYFAAHQSELPEFVAALESEGEQVAELLAALRPLAKAVQ